MWENVLRMRGIRSASRAYTLIDAFVTYAPTRLWNVTLRGSNLTDADYAISAYGPTQLILGQPISGEIAVNLRF